MTFSNQIIWILTAFILSLSTPTLAQQSIDDSSSTQADSAEQAVPSADAEQATSVQMLERQLAEHRQQNQALMAKDAELVQEIEKLKSEMHQLSDQRNQNAFDDELEYPELDALERFRIYGFFDLTLGKNFIDDEKGISKLVLSDKAAFAMTHLNLFFDSQMSPELEALVEVRLTFLPLGNQNEFELVDSQGVVLQGEQNREDTTVTDPRTYEDFQLGGIAIERAHLTYSPVQWFKILAGRFITPYGIWNIDHGSTVHVPILLPYLQRKRMVPLAQTGIQLFGKHFLSNNF